MARQHTTRLQLSGHRFLIRRTAHALVRGDARMLDDPIRAQSVSLLIGAALTVVTLIVYAALALVRPGSELGSAPILISPASGALYVQVDGIVHPVLNLASARLITGAAANPQPVSDRALATGRRGPLLGIPGAPSRIDPPVVESNWAVCDLANPERTVLVIGQSGEGFRAFGQGDAQLVSPRGEGPANTYLLFDGWRSAVDLRDIAAVRALHLEGVTPLPVSRALLDSVPEAPAVTAPVIADAGLPGPPTLGPFSIGTVVKLMRADAVEFYVVLGAGLQRVSRVAADLVRFTVAQPTGQPPEITADTVARAQIVQDLAVGMLPERVRSVNGAMICAAWDSRHPDPKTTLYNGDSPTVPAVDFAQRDGAGPNLDGISVVAGRSVMVRSTGLTGLPDAAGPLYLIDDHGVRYGIHDDDAAQRLGLSTPPVAGPWSMLALLPPGPELSRAAASIARDGMSFGRPSP